MTDLSLEFMSISMTRALPSTLNVIHMTFDPSGDLEPKQARGQANRGLKVNY